MLRAPAALLGAAVEFLGQAAGTLAVNVVLLLLFVALLRAIHWPLTEGYAQTGWFHRLEFGLLFGAIFVTVMSLAILFVISVPDWLDVFTPLGTGGTVVDGGGREVGRVWISYAGAPVGRGGHIVQPFENFGDRARAALRLGLPALALPPTAFVWQCAVAPFGPWGQARFEEALAAATLGWAAWVAACARRQKADAPCPLAGSGQERGAVAWSGALCLGLLAGVGAGADAWTWVPCAVVGAAAFALLERWRVAAAARPIKTPSPVFYLAVTGFYVVVALACAPTVVGAVRVAPVSLGLPTWAEVRVWLPFHPGVTVLSSRL